MGISDGYAPVAMTAFLKCKVLPFTITDLADVKLALPMNTSTPNSVL
jgi:hypothetical protein